MSASRGLTLGSVCSFSSWREKEGFQQSTVLLLFRGGEQFGVEVQGGDLSVLVAQKKKAIQKRKSTEKAETLGVFRKVFKFNFVFWYF